MAPLAPKFLRVHEQEFGFVEVLGLVTLVPAGGSSQRALALLAELHCSGVCRKGLLWVSLSVSVPEQSQFCQRRVPRASPADRAW